MAQVTIELIRGDRFGSFPSTYAAEAFDVVTSGCAIIKSAVEANAPEDQGGFKTSIVAEVRATGQNVTGAVRSTDDPAKVNAIVRGRRPGTYAPVDIIREWAERHGIPAFLANRHIFRFGIKARPVFDWAKRDTQGEVDRLLSGLWARIAQRL